MNQHEPVIYQAAAIRDAVSIHARPGALAVQHGQVRAAGECSEVKRAVGADCQVVDLGEVMLLPAMVNAHAHLDLTQIGPRPFTGSFMEWIRMVVRQRPGDATTIHQAVVAGLGMSHEAGVGWIGDIAGSVEAAQAMRQSASQFDIAGVSYVECLGFGKYGHESWQRFEAYHKAESQCEHTATCTVKLGVEPHAPYSTDQTIYVAAAQSRPAGLAVCTHLAETLAEVQFTREAAGEFAQLLKDIGRWDESIRATGKHPVDWLDEVTAGSRGWLLAHCNHVDDDHIRKLAARQMSVAYCPLASAYFGHTGHRYRDMLAAGVNVAMGTDSLICQPDDGVQPLGLLPALRMLYQRDHTSPDTLLRMATVNGARALGLPAHTATLQVGAPAKWFTVAIDARDPRDPWEQVLAGRSD